MEFSWERTMFGCKTPVKLSCGTFLDDPSIEKDMFQFSRVKHVGCFVPAIGRIRNSYGSGWFSTAIIAILCRVDWYPTFWSMSSDCATWLWDLNPKIGGKIARNTRKTTGLKSLKSWRYAGYLAHKMGNIERVLTCPHRPMTRVSAPAQRFRPCGLLWTQQKLLAIAIRRVQRFVVLSFLLYTLGDWSLALPNRMAGQLYTIPFSHYCELARWSLQEAKVGSFGCRVGGVMTMAETHLFKR